MESSRKYDKDEDKLRKCRERNRIHARNTRERKKFQFEMMQYQIERLRDEKKSLLSNMVDASVAEILIQLASEQSQQQTQIASENDEDSSSCSSNSQEKTNTSVSSETTDRDSPESVESDEVESDVEPRRRLKSSRNHENADAIRRERNRVHAKRTRQKKKMMMMEMETILKKLERDVHDLKRKERDSSTSDQESTQSIEEEHDSICSSGPSKKKRIEAQPVKTDEYNQLAILEKNDEVSQPLVEYSLIYLNNQSKDGNLTPIINPSKVSKVISTEPMDTLFVEAYTILGRGLDVTEI